MRQPESYQRATLGSATLSSVVARCDTPVTITHVSDNATSLVFTLRSPEIARSLGLHPRTGGYRAVWKGGLGSRDTYYVHEDDVINGAGGDADGLTVAPGFRARPPAAPLTPTPIDQLLEGIKRTGWGDVIRYRSPMAYLVAIEALHRAAGNTDAADAVADIIIVFTLGTISDV